MVARGEKQPSWRNTRVCTAFSFWPQCLLCNSGPFGENDFPCAPQCGTIFELALLVYCLKGFIRKTKFSRDISISLTFRILKREGVGT